MIQRKVDFYRHDLGEAELDSLRETLGTTFLTLGPRVGVFERRLSEALGVPHVVGVSSCTLGLHMVLYAFGVGPGDEVITTPMSFISTPNAALYVGATPVFADVDPATGAIDPEDVVRKITGRTKAILCVHLYGQLCNVRELRTIADRYGLLLIEDAAHGFEAERDGLRPGTLGDAAVFSFYATKTLTSGDGGAVATSNPELDARLRRLRNHGVSKDAASRYGGAYQHWDMMELGFKGALTDIEASLLLPQLDRAEARRARRQAAVEHYEERLRGVEGVTLMRREGKSAHHLFPVLVPRGRREEILVKLGQAGIGCAINYRAIHTLTYYRERFRLPEEALPNAAEIGSRTISLPLWPGIPPEDVDYVCDRLIEAVA
ncbi:MAG: DegT/DnrJ/EryC1/StrS family aminotransferase [Myxococcales bacterium]|nr:DegT/DnrJ/EryC1/StrS family aminotransferase [Polyangiaceae bacterium]MDW8248879.1 DegT/DnrJ/EryC1/StrS family aminotransferase [Myxococcales bacterium]